MSLCLSANARWTDRVSFKASVLIDGVFKDTVYVVSADVDMNPRGEYVVQTYDIKMGNTERTRARLLTTDTGNILVQIGRFTKYIEYMRQKLEPWTQAAIDNNITNHTKSLGKEDVGIDKPNGLVFSNFQNKDWRGCYSIPIRYCKLYFGFGLKDGKPYMQVSANGLIVYTEAQQMQTGLFSRSTSYYNSKLCDSDLYFTSKEQLDSFLNALNPDVHIKQVREYVQKGNGKDEIFK